MLKKESRSDTCLITSLGRLQKNTVFVLGRYFRNENFQSMFSPNAARAKRRKRKRLMKIITQFCEKLFSQINTLFLLQVMFEAQRSWSVLYFVTFRHYNPISNLTRSNWVRRLSKPVSVELNMYARNCDTSVFMWKLSFELRVVLLSTS